MGELRAFFAGGDSPPLVESLFDVRVGNRAAIVERRLRRVSHTCDYAVQSAQKINSLTRKHSTHAYGFSHAHVPHLTRTETWSRPGGLFPPFPRLNLGRGVHSAYFHAVLGQFRGSISVFLVGGRMVRFAQAP